MRSEGWGEGETVRRPSVTDDATRHYHVPFHRESSRACSAADVGGRTSTSRYTTGTFQAPLVRAPLTRQTGVHKPGFAEGRRHDADQSQPYSAPPASWTTGATKTDCGSKMKRHSATTKKRSLASYFKKVRTDEADGEEPPPSKDKTSPSSALVESQARSNFCSDSGECTGLYESPENEHKQDTHAPPGNDGGCSATPSDLCSTVNAGQSDAFTTGQCPRKVSGMAPTHSGSPPLCVTSANIFDLGLFVSKSNNVNDPEAMEKLLLNPWTPPANYDYPATGKRNLKFQPHWVDRYPWLVYSEELQGALCKYCVVFASECAGKGEHQRLGCFVTKEFTNYKKSMDAFKSHASSSYYAM
ncbi:hypothetical protein HPB51_007736 [Rhipicephalus microplus]|uniref:TTF-type domain-containing protein n=1 Tax=Rhipicephalus microplus TaxID=6941 RepID=A0A9J6DU38_RHIMP|nr:hypothetical protein HPB51_007736 [Rhipicephalus microplus]